MGEHVNIVSWWHGNSNLKLTKKVSLTKYPKRKKTNLPRKIGLPIEWFEIFNRLAGYQFLVQPNFVICGSARQEMFTETFGMPIHLVMQLR